MRRWFGLVALGLFLGLVVLLIVLGLTMDGDRLGIFANRIQIFELAAGGVLTLAAPIWKMINSDLSAQSRPVKEPTWVWSLRRRVTVFGSLALADAVTGTLIVVLHCLPQTGARVCPDEKHAPAAGLSTCSRPYPDRPPEEIGYLSELPADGHVFGDSEAKVQGQQTEAQRAEDRRFHDDQVRILRENRNASVIAENSSPKRGVVSVVYFAGLTTALNDDYDSAEAEELEGLYIAQRLRNAVDRDGPVLKIVIANGGAHMFWADYVARHMLVPLYRSDRSVLGVAGGDRTTSVTRTAAELLDEAGIPMVGTTLSADGFGDGLTSYRRLSEPNDREADVIADYVADVVPAYFRLRKDLYNSDGKTRPVRLTIYRPASDTASPREDYHDLYVETLVADLRRRFADQGNGLTVPEPTGKLDESLCGASSVVIYAGRHDRGDFSRFLDQMRACRGENVVTGRLPFVIADDGITRFVADPDKRDPAYQDIEISYVTKGIDVLRTGKSCVTAKGSRAGSERLDGLCAAYAALVNDPGWYARARPLWMGERVALAYDAARLFITALKQGPSSQAAVRTNIRTEPYERRSLAVVRIPMDSRTARPGCEYDASDHRLGGDGRLNGTKSHPCPRPRP